ncbi:M56 family metallopeptidase [Brevundimonas sp.]|uniref:M56 family metallopeptidase n=1 Tax=Brevundimonas sp. TaxID=1871086 RepID=UPI001211FEAC|nr:M56 family metallopeptidase [Brevundimonas sp.]TAJ63961.1 MAG: M56 family metallopeptidase [Brevundimonas sp.]
MSPVEILALTLAASIGVAAATGLAARAAEGVSDDPVWRDRLWSGAFWLPAITPVLTALFLLAPRVAPEPVVVTSLAGSETMVEPTGRLISAAAAPDGAIPFDLTLLALLALSAAGLLAVIRLCRLVRRARRLSAVIARAEHPSPALATMVGAPDRPGQSLIVRVSPEVPEAFLAGLLRPVLILPSSLIGCPPDHVRAVVAHEMAHLRRRDLTAMWLEETALTVMAANPLLTMLHARRRLAREEACDALALAGATSGTRRAYARTLIDALRDRAGIEQGGLALTFTGRRGAAALRRVRAILEPRPAVGRLTRRLTVAVGALAGGLVLAGSFALAGQTEADGPLIIDMDGDRSPAAQQWEMINAAIDPVFNAAWPGACGYSLNEADQLTIHLQRCDGSDSPDAQVLALQGRDPVTSPREAFEAVKAACDAGNPVTIDYRLEDARVSKTVACSKPARAPIPTRVLDLAIAYDGVAPLPGDRLHVTLGRDGRGEMELNHVVGLPAVAPRGLRTRTSEDFLMIGRAPRLRAILISKEGVVRAVSRPVTRPMDLGEDSATTEIVMEPGSAEAISDLPGWRRVQRLRAEGLSDEQAWRAAAEPE